MVVRQASFFATTQTAQLKKLFNGEGVRGIVCAPIEGNI